MTDKDKSFVFKEDLLNKLRYFIEDNDGNRISRNLRKILFDHIRHQQYSMDVEFEETLGDIEALMELMELMGNATQEWRAQFK